LFYKRRFIEKQQAKKNTLGERVKLYTIYYHPSTTQQAGGGWLSGWLAGWLREIEK